MSVRKCWTCGGEHDFDEACVRSAVSRSAEAAGGRLFETPDNGPRFGPVIVASYDGDDACCGDGIWSGERIRADGENGWVHEECAE